MATHLRDDDSGGARAARLDRLLAGTGTLSDLLAEFDAWCWEYGTDDEGITQLARRRMEEGHPQFGFRFLRRDNIGDMEEELADALNYRFFDWLVTLATRQ